MVQPGFRECLLVPALLVILVCVPTMGTGQSNAGSRSTSKFDDVIYNQEHRLAKAEQQQDRDFFTRTLDDKLIYVAFNGLVFTKKDIVRDLNYIDVSRYVMENVKIRALGSDAALATYDLRLKGSIAGKNLPAEQYASSVWLHSGDQWKLIFHQSTPARH